MIVNLSVITALWNKRKKNNLEIHENSRLPRKIYWANTRISWVISLQCLNFVDPFFLSYSLEISNYSENCKNARLSFMRQQGECSVLCNHRKILKWKNSKTNDSRRKGVFFLNFVLICFKNKLRTALQKITSLFLKLSKEISLFSPVWQKYVGKNTLRTRKPTS